MKHCLLVTLLGFFLTTGTTAGTKDSVPSDTSTATFSDPSAYLDTAEKPLWFYLDSLGRAAGWLPPYPDTIVRQPRVSTRTHELGLLEGFRAVRVDFVLQYSREIHVDSLQTGTLVMLEIWPGLFRTLGIFATIDAPDTAFTMHVEGQDLLSLRWRAEFDSTRYVAEQLWAWHRIDERPVDLQFARVTQRALDQALPPGYYAAFAGRLDPETMCLTAPVYRPLDDFMTPTGGEVEVCYEIVDLTLATVTVGYQPGDS